MGGMGGKGGRGDMGGKGGMGGGRGGGMGGGKGGMGGGRGGMGGMGGGRGGMGGRASTMCRRLQGIVKHSELGQGGVMGFREWLIKNRACESAMDWFDQQPDQSPAAIWNTCPRGDWLLWWHEKAGTPWAELQPVVRRAVNRALKHANVNFVVQSPTDYAEAARAARVESAARTAEAIEAAVAAGVARVSRVARAATAAAMAAYAAEDAMAEREAWEVENRQCADDCRELLIVPKRDKGK